jgi:probable F420-dependent oxidoreductase
LRVGIAVLPTHRSIDPAVLAARAEELGFESLWTPEQPTLPVETTHDIPREWGDIVDPFVMLARASATTSTLILGTAVVVVPEHSPILLAKRAATLDALSGGRFLFGIGVGSVEEEAAMFGVDFPRRWTQAAEAAAAMKALWTEEQAEHHGVYYDFPPVYCYPKPARKPHPPLLLGTRAKASFRRIVEWGDGWIPIRVTPDDVRRGRATLDRLCEETGRDPASIEITVADVEPEPDAVRAYEKAGVDRAIVGIPEGAERPSLAHLDKIARALLPTPR